MIFIDSRGDGEKAIAALLKEMHIPVELKHIDSGDYVFQDIAIERKTINDLICSVIGKNKHFFEQLTLMKDLYKKPIVLIEGEINWNDRVVAGIIYSIIGSFHIPYLNSRDKRDSASKIAKLYDKYGAGMVAKIPPAVVKKETSPKKIKVAMLQCIDGVGPVLATKLEDEEPLLISTVLGKDYLTGKLSDMIEFSGTPKKSALKKRVLNVFYNNEV